MPRAVRFDHYGGTDVLEVVEVALPAPAAGQVLVRVKAAAVNPGEASIREGLMHERWPAHFPSGQGSDLAGVVDAVGERVGGVSVGDEVIGFTDDRSSQAEFTWWPPSTSRPARRACPGRSPARCSWPARPPTRPFARSLPPPARPSSSRARPVASARSPCNWRGAPMRA